MSLDQITPEMFEKLTDLAALSLRDDEKEYLRGELNHQLAAVKELSEIALEDSIEPTLHGIDVQGNEPRADLWFPFADPALIVALAPESEDGQFAVPDVAHLESKGEL